MKFLLPFLLVTLCWLNPGASFQQNKPSLSLQSIVTSELGAHTTIENNKSGTFALAYSIHNRSVKYIVIRLTDLKIVVDQKTIRGSIAWNDDMCLKEVHAAEMVKKNADGNENAKLIDLRSFIVRKR